MSDQLLDQKWCLRNWPNEAHYLMDFFLKRTNTSVKTRFRSSLNMSMLMAQSPSNPRLIIVSNRLPVTVKSSQDGAFEYSTSTGGLVSGLNGISYKMSSQWYGWPGIDITEGERNKVKETLWRGYRAVPVWLSEDLADSHYNGFSSANPIVPYGWLASDGC